tara:strand:- start:3 stop:953 length:951 start_codon:yes stop_codon:yes gene_type:complete
MSLNNNPNFQFFVSEPLRKNNLSVFFLSAEEKKVDNYLCFSEALKKNLISVNEVNERGSVKYLKLSNKSNHKILVLESELITGNALKQDRVVDRTTLISENTTIMLQVKCCEKNRWSPAVANNLSVSDTLFFSKGRLDNSIDIYEKSKTDQFKIWDNISERLKDFKIKSFTGSTEEIYQKRINDIEALLLSFKPKFNSLGVAIAIGNRIISIDIFSDSNIFNIYFPRILRSAIIDSYTKKPYQNFICKENVYKLLRQFEKSVKKLHKSPGGCLGEEIKFNNNQAVGSCLQYNNIMIHFSGFLKDNSDLPQYKSEVA